MAAPYAEVEAVQFGVAGEAEVRREGTVAVRTVSLFNRALPVTGGPYDASMGTLSHDYTCLTCRNQKKRCPGHPGYLEAPMGVLQPLFMDEIRRWLKAVCLACGASMVAPERLAGLGRTRRLAEAATAVAPDARCPACDTPHPRIEKDRDDYVTFLAVATLPGGRTQTRVLWPLEIRTALQRVTAETVRLLGRPAGFHPERLVLTTVQVAPVTVRPAVQVGLTGGQSHHDINTVLQNIIRSIEKLQGVEIRNPAPETARALNSLADLYYTMVRGTSTSGRRGVAAGSRPVVSYSGRLPRKEGRLRRNLLGTRVWYVGRATISGNNTLAIDEVGVPVDFARTLQIEETVQEHNREHLMHFYLNGRRAYPGASRVWRRATGAYHDVEVLRATNVPLELGDVLYRDVVNGDAVFFNRQPSLERSAIGVHRAVVLEDPRALTLQMNVIACSFYNADFDGDEMNVFVPHGEMSRVEARLISAVPNNFISTKSSGPVNGQVQDSVVGCFLLTRDAAVMDRQVAMDLFRNSKVEPLAFGAAQAEWTGRQALSLLLERTPVTYTGRPTWYAKGAFLPFLPYVKNELRTVVRAGRLEQGVLDKAAVGDGAHGGLYHLVARNYTPRRALELIFAMQQAAVTFGSLRGCTISANDMILPPVARAEARQAVADLLREAEETNVRLLAGEIIPPIGVTRRAHYERLMQEALSAPDAMLRPVLTSIDPDTNGLFQMVATGSKGKIQNMLHIMGSRGQITINAERIRGGVSLGRTLLYCRRFTLDPVAYGFIGSNYIEGLSSLEFAFAMMHGRFDLINKALSTSRTGHANRKAIMALQSCVVDYFRRVTIAAAVVQPLYGEDGLDARQLEAVAFPTVLLSEADLAAQFRFTPPAGAPAEEAAFFEAEFARLQADREWYRRAFLRIERSDFSQVFADRRQVSVNVARVLRELESSGATAATGASPAELAAMGRRVAEFCEELPYVLLNSFCRAARLPVPRRLQTATRLQAMLVRSELCSRRIGHLRPPVLQRALDTIWLRYTRSLVEYGEAVGVLAAQAVSEPLTQYMLDSHHRSVVGGTDTSGIERPEEIFRARRVEEERSSEMLLFTRAGGADRAQVQRVANSIELLSLRSFVSAWQILFEPFPADAALAGLMHPAFAADRAWLEEFRASHPLLPPPANLTRWCLRLQLNRKTLTLKSMPLEQIVNRLRARYGYVYLTHSQETDRSVVLRAYVTSGLFKTQGRSTRAEALVQTTLDRMLETPVRGIPGIRHARVERAIRHAVAPDGALVREAELYCIRTNGTNLAGVARSPEIEPLTTVSSSIGDTLACFGIEAARAKIVSEIRRVMGSGAPNARHLMLYADAMTYRGTYLSLEKNGLAAREGNNVLLRMGASFPVQNLTDAALEGRRAPLYGMAGPMIMGTVPRTGTNYSSLVVDEEFVASHTVSVDQVLDAL